MLRGFFVSTSLGKKAWRLNRESNEKESEFLKIRGELSGFAMGNVSESHGIDRSG
jgi:hypothetical protein